MLKKMIICVAVVALLAVVGITIGVNISNRPEVVIKKSLENAWEDLAKREEFSAVFSVLEKGSVSVEMDRENRDVEGKLYFSDALLHGKAKIYAEDVKIKNGDNIHYFSAYLSSKQIYVTDSSILDQTYGIVRGGMEKAYLASPLSPEGGMGILDAEQHEFIRALLSMYDRETDLAIHKDVKKALERYEGKLEKIFLNHIAIKEENRKIRVCGTRVESRVITVTVNDGDLADMVAELYDTVSADKKLRDLVVKYREDISGLVGKDFDAVAYFDEHFLNRNAWSAVCDRLNEKDFTISVMLVTAPSSAVLRQLTVNMTTAAGEEELLFLDIGKNGVKTADYVTLDVMGTRYIYEVAESNKRLFEAYLYMEKDVIASLEINKKDERYTLTLAEDIEYLGKYLKDGDTYTITLDKIRHGEHTDLCDLQVTVDLKDPMPEIKDPKEVTNIFELPEEDWREIFAMLGYQGLKGTYSSVVDWFGLSLTFDGYGNLIMNVYQDSGDVFQTIEAVYEINGNTISIQTIYNGHEMEWIPHGDYSLVVEEEWIEIGGVKYQREG